MSIEELNTIKEKIEKMDVKHHIDILRIFKNHSTLTLNENTNGTFINITNLDDKIKNEILKYISYIEIQKTQLDKDENKKTHLETTFFK